MGRSVVRTNEFSHDLAALIEKARKGDQKALNDFIKLVEVRLVRFCCYLSPRREQAEELAQETLLKAISNLSQLDKPSEALPWLFQIARNLWIDHVRLKSISQEDLFSIQKEEVFEGGNLEEILSVRHALFQLDTDDRILLIMIDLEGDSYLEAAQSLGLTEDAIRSRIYRIRKTFLEKWKKAKTK